MQARPAPAQNSGDFLALVGTDGFVELAATDESRFAAGSVVPLYPVAAAGVGWQRCRSGVVRPDAMRRAAASRRCAGRQP